MPTLAYRRVRGDMIQMFKLHYGFYDKDLPDIFSPNERSTRGHDKKKVVKSSTKNVRKYNFSVRSIELWNSLPHHVVNSEDIKSFEIALDEHWDDQEIKYDDFKKDIKIINNNRFVDYQV